MIRSIRYSLRALLVSGAVLVGGFHVAAIADDALPQKGKAALKSAGPLAFGPSGVLFIGDPEGAAVFAIGVGTPSSAKPVENLKVEGIDTAVASLLGTKPDEILINDLAVQPETGLAYLSVSRGKGPGAAPALVRVDGSGKVSDVSLDEVNYAKVSLSNAPAEGAKDRRGTSLRQEAITDLLFTDGKVFVAGLSNEEFASNLRAIPFPFKDSKDGASVEIYHGAHGQLETRAPVRTFVPMEIDGKTNIVAAYTCTPLVTIPVDQVKDGEKVKGKTVAELGNRNRPLDLIVYKKDGKNHLLLANSARGVMKISTDAIDSQTPITSRISDTAGLKYDTLNDLKGVEQLDKVNDRTALVLVKNEGAYSLLSIALP
ncbi:MAG: hypothetical protein U0892_06405 [Pirellulales bacterium]